jgi:ATP-dependent 26S proteasome regulatory subunit
MPEDGKQDKPSEAVDEPEQPAVPAQPEAPKQPVYTLNDEVFRSFRDLVAKIHQLNKAVSPEDYGTGVSLRKWMDNPISRRSKVSVQQARSELYELERAIRSVLENTGREAVLPPFLEFCRKHGLDFHEMLILSIVLSQEETVSFRARPATVDDIQETLGGGYLPLATVKKYIQRGSRLRERNILKLFGPRRVLQGCMVLLNPDMLEEIYKEDYDPTIEVLGNPCDDDDDGPEAGLDGCEEKVSWDSVVLPPAVKEMIQNGIAQVKHSKLFLEGLGYGKAISVGRGVSMLFSGPPGTGKTMTAKAVATELGKPLMTVNYSQLENKYVGVTEKNIERCFAEARKKEAVLLFDEADAVLYARNGQERSWANRDVSVLLQAIERFDGVVILTTNQGKLLDPALERRISIMITFPMPDAKAREGIFRGMAPKGAEEGIDYKGLAAKYEFSGGQIKNVWVNAGRLAIRRTNGAEGTRVTREDLEKAARMEIEGAGAMDTSLEGRKVGGYA